MDDLPHGWRIAKPGEFWYPDALTVLLDGFNYVIVRENRD